MADGDKGINIPFRNLLYVFTFLNLKNQLIYLKDINARMYGYRVWGDKRRLQKLLFPFSFVATGTNTLTRWLKDKKVFDGRKSRITEKFK